MINWSHLGSDDFEKQRVTISMKGKDNRHMNVARLLALRSGRLPPRPQEITQVLISVRGHSAVLRIKSAKNPHAPIRRRTRKLSDNSSGSQSNVPPHTSTKSTGLEEILQEGMNKQDENMVSFLQHTFYISDRFTL
jgi:hypothetical protein